MRTTIEPREIKVKTVEKTLTILEILAEQNKPLSLTLLGRLSKLSLSTTYRLLNTLCQSGFIERELSTGHYKLGLKAFLIGNAALQNIELRPTALPYLKQLAQNCAESIYLAIRSGENILYSDCVKTTSPIQIGIQTGVLIPASQTSSGKVIIANLSLVEQQGFAELYLKNKLIANLENFLAELKTIKLSGFCAGINNSVGTFRELSVPIYNHLTICVGAISIIQLGAGKVLTKTEEKLLEQLNETSLRISQALGYSISNSKN
jgi:DNA-binding IclR family transcriptional regulator